MIMSATPSSKSSSSSSSSSPITPLASPRLRSPRGSPNPRHHGGGAGSVVYNLLRHTKGMLIVAAVAVIVFFRPSSMDPGGNLGSFIDSSSTFDLGALMGGISTSTLSASPSFMTPGQTIRVGSSYLSSEDEDGDGEEEEEEATTIEQSYQEPPETTLPSPNLKAVIRSSTVSGSTGGNSGLLSNYEPFLHPLIALPRNETSQMLLVDTNVPAVDVHMVVDVSNAAAVGPQSKFLLDGLERSPYTNVVGMTFLNPNLHQVQIGKREKDSRPLVWMVDWGSMLRDCHRLERVLEKLNRKPTDYVLLVDYSSSTRQSKCNSYLDNDPYVRLAKRSIVTNRHYNHTGREIVPGRISENSAMTTTAGGEQHPQQQPVMQASLVVRERFVSALRSNSREQNPMKSSRRTDVCFFWKHGDYSHYGFWRRDVSNFIEQLGKTSNFTTLIDVVANDEEGMALGNIQLKYIKALLHCKIAVLAQRDEWEDHYRLYESLASGALVLMDTMLAPPEGLRNKTNVLVYDSLESLKGMIEYGLERDSRRQSIARRGMQLALGRYRSWHRVEQLLFGQPLFQVDQPLVEPPPKMTRPQMTLLDGEKDVPT